MTNLEKAKSLYAQANDRSLEETEAIYNAGRSRNPFVFHARVSMAIDAICKLLDMGLLIEPEPNKSMINKQNLEAIGFFLHLTPTTSDLFHHTIKDAQVFIAFGKAVLVCNGRDFEVSSIEQIVEILSNPDLYTTSQAEALEALKEFKAETTCPQCGEHAPIIASEGTCANCNAHNIEEAQRIAEKIRTRQEAKKPKCY